MTNNIYIESNHLHDYFTCVVKNIKSNNYSQTRYLGPEIHCAAPGHVGISSLQNIKSSSGKEENLHVANTVHTILTAVPKLPSAAHLSASNFKHRQQAQNFLQGFLNLEA